MEREFVASPEKPQIFPLFAVRKGPCADARFASGQPKNDRKPARDYGRVISKDKED